MPTLEELHAADQAHAAAIAELRAGVAEHRDILQRHAEMITELRIAYGNVATKADLAEVGQSLHSKIDALVVTAYNSIPAKVAAGFAGGMFLLALISLVAGFMHGRF